MDNIVSRRDFVKGAGAAAGFAIAAGQTAFSYAANSKVRVGCIGTGGQGTFHIYTGLAGTPDIEIVAVCDVYTNHRKPAVLWTQFSNAKLKLEGPVTGQQKAEAAKLPKPTEYFNYKEMLEREDLNGVVISTPLATHYPISMDCLDAGKFVFCEKTLVTSIEDGQNLIRKCHETGKWIQVGHQRRYNPRYNLAMNMAYDYWSIGRISHITAQWHRNEYWRRPLPQGYELSPEEQQFIPDLEKHLNWRMYEETSGGLYTELATHQTDVANWFLKAVPARVHAFSGLDYWRDGRTVDDNIAITYEYDMGRKSPGFARVDARSQLQDPSQLLKSYKVRFQYSSILMNARRGASELIQGDRGSFQLTEKECWLFPEPDGERRFTNFVSAEESGKIITSGESLHPLMKKNPHDPVQLIKEDDIAPDVYQFRAFAHHIQNGGVPRNNQMVGYTTALTAIAAQQSRETGTVVEIDPASYTFDFEVPSFYEYESQTT